MNLTMGIRCIGCNLVPPGQENWITVKEFEQEHDIHLPGLAPDGKLCSRCQSKLNPANI